jgi:hypothetical protein
MITSLGLVFLPLCLFFWRTPARLLELIFIGSAFAAAAAIVIGSYGVTPGLVPTSLFVAFVIAKMLLGTRYPAEKIVVSVLFPFILLTVLAIISSLLIPRFFEDQILVWPQKAGAFFVITPLAPNSGNYTQDLYLAAAASVTIFGSIYLTRSGFDLVRLMNAYFVANLLVVFISLWQFASNISGLWFPTDFFLSNPGWALLSDESIGAFIRITGPFSEPAALASYLCGAVGASAWVILNGHKSLLARVVFVLSGSVVLLSTSTTGYAALAIIAGLITFYSVIFGNAGLRIRVGLGFLMLIGIVLAASAIIPIVAPKVADIAVQITNATLTKQGSSSYNDRTSTDIDSLHEFVESYGLGVGWGSNRSSSLIPGLLAAMGLWGALGIFWFAIKVTLHVYKAHRLADSPSKQMVMHGCTGGILGTLSAAVLSAPGLTSPDFYLLLALLIGTAGRIRYDATMARAAAHLEPEPVTASTLALTH